MAAAKPVKKIKKGQKVNEREREKRRKKEKREKRDGLCQIEPQIQNSRIIKKKIVHPKKQLEYGWKLNLSQVKIWLCFKFIPNSN